MTSARGTKKPICQACNRPFDPRSPGATNSMGPTCARNHGLTGNSQLVSQSSSLFSEQFDFGFEPGLGLEFIEGAAVRFTKSRGSYTVPPQVPKSLKDKYLEAKMAFDELYREFHASAPLIHGDPARAKYSSLLIKELEIHSLCDSTLDWLEPEYDVHLLVDIDKNQVYYWRVFNDVATLLHLDLRASVTARNNFAAITSYTRALQAYRQNEASQQLTLV